jgi:two-component system sensor histidine kinase PilS (NtrC family)
MNSIPAYAGEGRAEQASALPAHSPVTSGAPSAQGLASPDFPWRVLSLLNAYRIFVALLLLGLFYLVTGPRAVGHEAPLIFLVTSFAYLVVAVVAVYMTGRRKPALQVQLYLQISADVIAVTILMSTSGGIESGLGNLLVVSIGAASILIDRRMVGLFPALAAIALLTEHGVARLEMAANTADSMPAGLLGATLFAVALAAQPLASRLRESEALARQRGVDLANMAELNDYIIQHLRESLLVVDADDRVRLVNGAAQKALAVQGQPGGRLLQELSPALQDVVSAWRADHSRGEAVTTPMVGADGATTLVPNIAELGQDRPCALLIFLEDQSLIAERVQQSKLAALGRLSASIAHEIRNPVGAMSHAAQLLGESDDIVPADRRLTDIIHDNALRISTIVDNVMQLSRPRHVEAETERFVLAEWVDAFAREFTASYQLSGAAVAAAHDDPQMQVRMDPSHLHQVMWNLCDNALKYGAPNEHGQHVLLRTGRVGSSARPYLAVIDFGPGIEPDRAERIFEPFYTSHHGGTGLGLFLARQLCECNGAALACQQHVSDTGGSCFRIVFSDPERWMTERTHAAT